MEAMRLNAGLPLYESGHATHVYGPLLTVALAGVFRVAGLNLLAARITMSILSFALAIFLSAILCRDTLRPWLGFAVLLLLGINFRTHLIFLSAQPDCVAALFGVVALSFWIKQRFPIAIASFIALTALLSFFLQFDQAAALLFARHGDGRYGGAVATARELGAISPQDPTIAYRASGYIGLSLFFELDAHAVNGNWPDELPTSILQEIARARYVMTVRSYVPRLVFERGLLRNSFHPLEIDKLNGVGLHGLGENRSIDIASPE